MAITMLNENDLTPRNATRINGNGHPVTVQIRLTLAILADARIAQARAAWSNTPSVQPIRNGAIWGELAPVTPIRPAVAADDISQAA